MAQLNPTALDFGIPIDYIPSQHVETLFNNLSGYIRMDLPDQGCRGLAIWPVSGVNTTAQTQQLVGLHDPFMLGYRFMVDHAGSMGSRIGVWSTTTDPWASDPSNGIWIESDPRIDPTYFRFAASYNGTVERSDWLFANSNDGLRYDFTVGIEGGAFYGHWLDSSGWHLWQPTTLMGVPTGLLRPSASCLRGGSTAGGLIIVSRQVKTQ